MGNTAQIRHGNAPNEQFASDMVNLLGDSCPDSGTAAGVGLPALLVGAFGSVAADVMMVVLAAIAGCYVSLSSVKIESSLID